MFVARYTYSPQYDIRRNWCGWIGLQGKSPEHLADLLIDGGHVKLPSRLEEAYWSGDTEAAIQYVLETCDIRFHEEANIWLLVHHEGLSCWPLQASSIDEAIEEARLLDESGQISWCGFGHRTVGDVRYVARISDVLHIFWCDDTAPETDY